MSEQVSDSPQLSNVVGTDETNPKNVTKDPVTSSNQAQQDNCENSSQCSSLDMDEVRCIMKHAECDMIAAIAALKKHGNIVDAILEITP